jgi:hypothetical protein
MSTDVIYTASDLDRRRREVTDTARRGLARIRDTDGTGLVLLPAHHYEVLETVSRWYDRLDVVERARAKPAAERVPADFGDLTWLRHPAAASAAVPPSALVRTVDRHPSDTGAPFERPPRVPGGAMARRRAPCFFLRYVVLY